MWRTQRAATVVDARPLAGSHIDLYTLSVQHVLPPPSPPCHDHAHYHRRCSPP